MFINCLDWFDIWWVVCQLSLLHQMHLFFSDMIKFDSIEKKENFPVWLLKNNSTITKKKSGYVLPFQISFSLNTFCLQPAVGC